MLLSKEKQKKDTKVKGKWIKLYNPLQQTKKRKKKKSQKQIKIFHLVVDCVTLLLPWRSLCTIHNTTQKTFSESPSLSVIKLKTTKKAMWMKQGTQSRNKKKKKLLLEIAESKENATPNKTWLRLRAYTQKGVCHVCDWRH